MEGTEKREQLFKTTSPEWAVVWAEENVQQETLTASSIGRGKPWKFISYIQAKLLHWEEREFPYTINFIH